MAQIDLGKLKFAWKGNYADSTAYEVDDVVFDKSTAWMCTTAVAASNTTDPEANSSFERMASGLNWRGTFDSSLTYYLNDIAKNGTSLYRYKHTTASSQEPPNATYWDVFLQTGDSNVITTSGDLTTASKDDVIERFPISTVKDATLSVKEQTLETFPATQKVVYSVNTTGTNTAILTGEDSSNVGGGGDSANAAVTLTRGKEYYFQVPTGQTYSFKDTASGSYSTSGTGGRLTTGLDKYSVTGGGMFRFVPTQDHPNSTVVLRDEAGGADVVAITLVDQKYGISWTTNEVDYGKRMPRLYNHIYNTFTESVSADAKIPAAVRKWGRGLSGTGHQSGSYRTGGYIDSAGQGVFWGYTDNSSPSHGLGFPDNGQAQNPMTKMFRWPLYYFRALAGKTADAKWLKSIDGQDLGLTVGKKPKLKELITNYYGSYALFENGMLFFSGENSYGAVGSGRTSPSTFYGYVPCVFYDDSDNLLTGTDRPKIKYVCDSRGNNDGNYNYGTYFAIDTEGYLYCWGYNGYKSVGDTTYTNLHKAKRMASSLFNNEKIVLAYGSSPQFCTSYAITETGKLYAWGQNDDGQVGNGNQDDTGTPFEITGRASANGQTNPLLNKKVVAINTSDGNQNYQGIHILTDEGKVYFLGYSQSYGESSGVWHSTSTMRYGSTSSGADTDFAKEISFASTTINSDNQKVVSMWRSGGAYYSTWFITDGGDSNKPKIYACGRNDHGQLGIYRGTGYNADSSSRGSTSDNEGSGSSSWHLAECQFRTFGDVEQTTSSDTYPNEVSGTQYTFSDSTHANYQQLQIGRPVKVSAHQVTSETSCPAVLLDDNGQLFLCGYWGHGYKLNMYNRFDDWSYFDQSRDWVNRWTPVWNQPEPMEDFAMMGNNSEDQWIAIGKSGRVYLGGYSANHSGGHGDNEYWHGLQAARHIGF